jgi:DNA-binding transcriptional MerR regulator
VNSVLPIGDFSRATHLSVKMLRHYHELGLLEPVDVDADSGYRRYAAEQIVTAQIIRRFRDLEMPLEDIHAVLQAPDVETRNRVIANHLARGVLVPGVRGNALGSGSGGRPVLRAESRRWHAPPRSRVWCPGRWRPRL